jgi:hypothetical protein
MRALCASVIGLTLLTALDAQPPGKEKSGVRFRIAPDYDAYPQKTPKQTLGSVLKVLTAKKYDYLLAHLADPEFVKARLKGYKKGLPATLTDESKDILAFQRLVKATTEHFRNDPTKGRELARFYTEKDAEWEAGESVTTVSLKSLPSRKVFLRKVGELWYLEDRDREDGKKDKEDTKKDKDEDK